MKCKKFKIVKGKWKINNLYDVLEFTNFDIFINSHRELPNVKRSKITKEHNYIFKDPRSW